MPIKSGMSHGVAAFVTLIIGTILSKLVWDLVPPLGQISLFFIEIIRATTGMNIPTDEQFTGTVVVMVALAFIWGVFYHFRRHG